MPEDFKIQVEADLDTSKAEKKLADLMKDKKTIKLDIDINNQNLNNLQKNIEKGIKNTKIDTSAITKQIADSFNITDKSVLKNLTKQLNNMVSSLGKTWNGSKYDFSKASGFYSGIDNISKQIVENGKIVKSATGYYDDFYNYFKNKKIYVSDDLKKALGGDIYKELLQNNIGKITKDSKKGIAIDALWGDMSNLFPEHFSQNITNQADQIIHTFDLIKKARQEMTQVINASDMTGKQKFEMTDSAYSYVIDIAKDMSDKLNQNIQLATDASKTSIDLDVNINADKITSDIRQAIENAGASTGEALNLDLQIDNEQLISNLRTSISKIASGDEPVKIEVDVDKNGLQEKLNAACHDMEIPVDFKIDAEDIASKIKSAVDSITDIELDLKVNTDSVREAVNESIKKVEPEYDESGLTQLQQALHNVNLAGQQSQSVFSSLGSTFKEAFSAYSLANLLQDALYKIADAGREAVATVKEFNDIKTNLAMATNADSDYINNLMKDYNTLAEELGSVTSSVAESADSWLRQGRSMKDTNSLIKDSLVLSKDAELSSSDASEILTATLNGYQMAADQASRVNDILTSIDLESASGADSIGKALMKVASQANNAGVSLEKTSAIIATIKDVTQDSDESIGTAMKSILSRMNQIRAGKFVDSETGESLNDTEKVLKKIGISMRDSNDQFKDSESILDDVANKWNTLDSNSKKATATAMAGTYQYNKFIAMMDNWDKVEKLTNTAFNSDGTANKKFEDNYLNSLEAKTNALKASMESLATNLISDDMYSGVLDGTKAITDFVDKTNLLKGALAGLGTAGGLFVFKQIGSFVKEATQEFSNLGTAMDMLKAGNLGTSEFQKLLTLTQNLSKSQTELVLSSTALSNEQRVAILTGQGMSTSEAEATVTAMGLSTANASATASTVSLGTAFKGLWSTLMANPLILVAAGVTATVTAYSAYQQSVEDALKAESDAGQKFIENTQSIQENIDKVKELRESLASGTLSEEEAYQAKSDLLSIQNQLSESYGSQADGIDLVNGKLDEQISKMNELSVNQANDYLNDNGKIIDKAQEEMSKKRDYKFGDYALNNVTYKDELNSLAKEFDHIGLQKKSDGTYSLKFTGDASEADEEINRFMTKLRELKDSLGDDVNTVAIDSIISQGESILNDNQKVLEKYQEASERGLKASMISKGFSENSPATIYNEYEKAIDKYNEALASGDTSQIEKAKSAFDEVKASVDGVTEKYSDFKPLFNELGEGLDESAIKAFDFQNALKDAGMEDTIKKFKDLQDVDLKGMNFKGKDLNETQQALSDVVDKAQELGFISDDSSESVAKVVDMLTQMGLTATVSTDNLTSSFNNVKNSINDTTNALSTMKDILSESVSGAGISQDNVDNFRNLFGKDAEKALEKTANGFHINQKAYRELQEQMNQSTKADYLKGLATQQEALQKINQQIAKGIFNGEDVSGLQAQKSNIESNISSIQDLITQYQSATSAYQQWQNALSGGEEGDMYDSIQGGIDSAKDLYDKGLVGTNKFREYVDLMSNQDLSTASVDEVVAAYESAMPKIERYFTEGREGVDNFLADVQNLNSEWAHMNEDGTWQIDFGIGNDQEIADALGIDVEAVQAIMRKMKDYGGDINLDQPVASLDELKTAAQSAKEALNGISFEDISLDGINLDSTSFSEITDNINTVKDYIEEIEDSDLEPDVKTDRLQEANAILEYLVGLQSEVSSQDIEINVNADELESKIDEDKSKLDEFKNDSGTVDLSVDGAQEAIDNLQSLLYQKEQLNAPAVMSVDASSVDGELGNAIAKVQEFQSALQELNVQNELKSQGVDIDTSAAQEKVNSLASEIQGINPDIMAKLEIDTSSVNTIQSSIAGLTPEIMVKAGVDASLVTGYQPTDKESTVKFKADHSAVDAYNPEDKSAKVTYSVVVSGLGKLPGDKTRTMTYNIKTNGEAPKYNGTAHVGGTFNSNGLPNSWKTKKSETALVGEVGTELVATKNGWHLVGENGAEFTNIPKNSVVFNSKQTEELLKNGHIDSRGSGSPNLSDLPDSFVDGTAFSSGSLKSKVGKSGSKSTSTKSKKKSQKSSRSKKSSGSSSSGSSGNSSGSSSSSSSSKDTENLTDWIKVFLSRNSRLTDLSEDAIDRAVGLINKMSAATDTIQKVQNEISANQQAANKYLEYANQVGLPEDYKSKIRNGQLSIENITDENTRDLVSKYQEYYEAYLDASDKVLDLQDKLTDLAEKRLEIIEKEYNYIEDIQTSLQDRLEADRDLLKSLGTAINNSLNVESLNESVKAQEEIYNQLTKKLADYQAEVDSQLKSGLMKQGSEQWYDAMKNINDFTANIAKASSELIELSDKLREIKYDTLKYIIDGFSRSTDKLSAYIDLLDAKDEKVPEELYQQQIDNNNASIQKQYALREEKLKEQGLYDVGSERYQDLAEDISKADEEILKLQKDNEDLKDSIYELRISNLEKAIQGYSDLEDELKDMRDLLNDDAFLDKNGGITDEGLAQIALLSQSLGNAKKTIADYTTGLQKLKELYENGIISLDEYNDKSAEYRKGIREATSDVKSYQDSLTSLYTDALKAEVDALDKIIDKRKKALEAKEDYYNYDKKIRSQQKDVDTIKAQIAALEGVNDAASQAKLKKLKQDLADAEDTLSETQRDHRNDMISQGYDKISDDMADMLENVEYDISHSADKQLEIINSMLNKAVGSYQEAYNKINSIITNTGFVGSTDFSNNQSQLGSSEGAKNQVSNASQSQTEANKNPSSSASGTITSPIKDNKAENDRITNDIMKPEDTTNRKVAELKVNKSSISVQEGQGTTLTYTIRPNDAVNKNLSISYSAPTIATASATNGVISINGLRPGNVTVTISTTDGSGISQTVNITVTKKPDPPKPAPAPPVNTSSGDGVPRVGDVVTFTGKYYNDSWGARPVGGLYSGVQGGVVIDGRSARAYGGSARRTGDYSVHIKSADGRYGDLGWVKLSQLSGYKDGTLGVADDEYAWTGEGYKSELVVRRNDGAILTHMNKGDGVVPNPETVKLMKFTEKYLNGEGELDLAVANLAQNSFVQEAIDGMKMAQSQNISNMKKMGNVTVENHYDSLLTVNGDIDKDTFPGVQEMCKKACDYTMKEFAKDLRKKGFR